MDFKLFSNEKKKPRLLITITGGNNNRTKGAKYLSDALKAKKVDFDFVEPSRIMLEVSNSIKHDKIYIRRDKADSDGNEYGRVYRKKYDGVIVRASKGIVYVASVLRHLSENIGVYCTASGQGILDASRKFVTHQVISSAGVRTPKTVLFSSPRDFKFLTDLVGGVGGDNKVVCKITRGSQGIGVCILETPLAASTMLETFSKKKIPLLLQEFIETADTDSEKFDIRLIVVGKKVVSSMKRYSVKGDFRSNYSKSKNAEKYTPTKEQVKMAVKAAQALGLDFAGVDIAVDVKTGNNYVIEVNSNPGTGIIGITGYNHFLDLVQHVLDQAKKTGKKLNTSNYVESYGNDFIWENGEPKVRPSKSKKELLSNIEKNMVKVLSEKNEVLSKISNLEALEPNPKVRQIAENTCNEKLQKLQKTYENLEKMHTQIKYS